MLTRNKFAIKLLEIYKILNKLLKTTPRFKYVRYDSKTRPDLCATLMRSPEVNYLALEGQSS